MIRFIRNRALLVIAWAIVPVLPAMGQTFDVVSIKPNHGGEGGGGINTMEAGRFAATNVGLLPLIREAFGVKQFQIVGGPAWMENEKYDVVGSGSTACVTEKALESCVLAMLTDRFQLKYHRETRELPVYSMVAARGGPKLKDHVESGEAPACSGACQVRAPQGLNHINFVKATPQMLARQLERFLDRLVNDDTGLKGEYDFSLEWTRNPDASDGLSLFTALQQQLGLRLESTKGPVEVIVIDGAERASEN